MAASATFALNSAECCFLFAVSIASRGRSTAPWRVAQKSGTTSTGTGEQQRIRRCQGRKFNLDSPVDRFAQAIPLFAGLPA